ncbi:AmmeMemoRadiSam system protein B, partial [Patescibacteria group bacterium]|nr:AmmeMemoRadiSam system protein B [Patescibacteria group bacterium]
DFETVILIGPSHSDWFNGSAVYTQGYWQIPFGKIEVDSELAQKLINENEKIFIRNQAHVQEHCLEVMLPFLQKTLKDFKIVPIIISQSSDENVRALAQALEKYIDEKTLIIISSDLSHYPSYEIANQVDEKTIQAILTGELEQFDKAVTESMAQGLPGLDTCACGGEPIKVGLVLAQSLGLNQIKLLKYANSGDILGDYSRVVGYPAIAFSQLEQNMDYQDLLEQDKEILLKIARQSIEEYLESKKVPEFKDISPRLKQAQGAFVTLRRNHQLRGCIGRIVEEKQPLYLVVSQMAIAAATEDGRFLPVELEEMKDIEVEVSVLSPLKKIKDPFKEIEMGKHGVVVSSRGGSAFGGQKGVRSGVFLPQVATENNWDLETFMGQLCYQKAGLPMDAWKTGELDIYTFTADVFEE